jgi:hypothetical protein
MDEAAPHNLMPGGRQLRLMIGGLLAAFSLCLLALLIGLGAGRAWRLFALPSLWGAALCFFQARARTCVFLAARGLRETAQGTAAVGNAQEHLELERRARRVHLQALAAAAAAAALALLFPVW